MVFIVPTSVLSCSRGTTEWPWRFNPGRQMENISHTPPPQAQSLDTFEVSLPFYSSPQQTNCRVSLPLSPVSFPSSPSSFSPATAESSHSSPLSHCTSSECQEKNIQCLSPVNSSDQDDLTCLNWLHQRGNLLPLQPLPKISLPQLESSYPTQPLPPASSKPPYSFSSLIFMAIEDSPDKRLPVKDIYDWIVNNFPFYRTASGGWRNSVRHNLSLSKSFRRIHRDKSQVRIQVTTTITKRLGLYYLAIDQVFTSEGIHSSEMSSSNTQMPHVLTARWQFNCSTGKLWQFTPHVLKQL